MINEESFTKRILLPNFGPQKLLQRILIPLAFTLLLLLSLSIVSIYWLQRQHLNEEVESLMKEVAQLFEMKQNAEADVLASKIYLLQLDKKLQNAYLAKDREALLRHAMPFFNAIKAQYQVTHFYFIELNKLCFLRVHHPQRYGDFIERLTLANAISQTQPSVGIELNQFGRLTLRVVYPWRINGELIGYIELAKEIKQITQTVKNIFQVELFFSINKSFIKHADWQEGLKMSGRTGNWGLLKDTVIIEQTLSDIPKQLKDALKSFSYEAQSLIFQSDNKQYYAGFLPLIDAGDRKLGEIIIVNDVSEQEAALQSLVHFLIFLCVVIACLLFGFFYFLLSRIESRLNKAHETMRINGKIKDQFLANTAHELRTPLNGMISIAESIIENYDTLSPQICSNIAMIAASGRRLAHLVNDISDFSKLLQHNIVLQLKAVNLGEMVEIVIMMVQPLKGKKTLQLINALDPNLPPAYADENRLQQILYNLISNAIKFTEYGQIEISAQRINDQLSICISDSGIGIPTDKLSHIFEAFEQVKGSTNRNGTGLGLALTKQLVNLHHGKIWAESIQGVGSEFTFTLPIAKEAKPSHRSFLSELLKKAKSADLSTTLPQSSKKDDASKTEQALSQKQFKILIVDDELEQIELLKNYLAIHNYVITQSSSGQEALALLEENAFQADLILLDSTMPNMTGYEICLKIREFFPATVLPILMLTAENQINDIVKALNIGANDYLTKPVSKEELLARIKIHLQLSQANRSIANLRQITDSQQIEKEHTRYIQELDKLNTAYERFVPKNFLSLLDKQSILDVELGDQVEKEMTILFSDIRNFTSLSENMTPPDNFKFINAYLSRMEPIIAQHNGFIDKYIGDAIMALFPNADDAVQAALGMLKRLTQYNLTRGRPGRPILKIGIGLNTGKLMLGTVGGQNRMEGTVISDAVNLASRVEDLTKIYNTTLLMTEQTYVKLSDPWAYQIRVIDAVIPKGKSEEVTVYEIFDADPPESLNLKYETRDDFELGFVLYHSKEAIDAKELFEKVLEKNEQDKAAQVYLKRCEHFYPKYNP
jgi:signal transduction histidine kinase/class 3 adenylate cyclase/CheY-like chemotaxis protein